MIAAAARGYEADDALGTIVHEIAPNKQVRTIIASGDMDTLQLVSPRVVVYTMRKGLNDTVLFDEEGVYERYGFGPELLIDYKGLRGDPSDNIPGVKGVGEDSAMKLIRAFGSIEKIGKAIKAKGVEDAAKEAGVQKRFVQLVADHLQFRPMPRIQQQALDEDGHDRELVGLARLEQREIGHHACIEPRSAVLHAEGLCLQPQRQSTQQLADRGRRRTGDAVAEPCRYATAVEQGSCASACQREQHLSASGIHRRVLPAEERCPPG